MDIKEVYHIEITEKDWQDLKDCGSLHFRIDGTYCIMTKGL